MVVQRTGEHPATVVATRDVTPLLRRLELAAPTLPVATVLQDVAVVLPDPDHPGVTLRRRYTVRDAGPGHLAIEAVRHGPGPGAQWATKAAPGDAVILYGPRGPAVLPVGTRSLVVADDAGLPGVLELLVHLRGQPTHAVVEVADAAEEQDVAGIEWLHRDGRPAGELAALLAAARRWSAQPGDVAFVLAESRVTAAVRDHLQAAGIPREQVHAKGYWNREDPRRAR